MTNQDAYECCPSCGGFGNHGFEEESGNEYICYACYGTGQVKAEDHFGVEE